MKSSKNSTKYIILVGDGMADYPLEELDGQTPLERASTPNMDRVAACRIGLVKTIPEGMEPGSDIANLAILGYDPKIYHTGRSPLEAASMGVRLGPDEVAFRMNLVTLDQKSEDEIIMKSHSAGEISTEEAAQIVDTLQQTFDRKDMTIHPGVGYRHLLVWDKGPEKALTIPPHDVLDRNMAEYLNHNPQGPNPVPRLIRRSWPVLKDHPVNLKRKEAGLKAANSIWPWGQGRSPKIPLFMENFGLRGGVISAVDLIKGIGIYAGFEPIHVKGATGYLDTNYRGKAEGALKGLEALDFIFLHVEAPDEASHNGNVRDKIQSIEDFDQKVVGTVLQGLERFEDYRVMIISDHLTPIPLKTHTDEFTPFAWAAKDELASHEKGPPFTEKFAKKSGLTHPKGHELMPAFLSKS